MAIGLEDSFAQWREKINAIIEGSGSNYPTLEDGGSVVPDSKNTIDLRENDVTVTVNSELLTNGDTMEFVVIGRGSGYIGIINLDGVPFEGSIVDNEIQLDVYETFFKLLYIDETEGFRLADD